MLTYWQIFSVAIAAAAAWAPNQVYSTAEMSTYCDAWLAGNYSGSAATTCKLEIETYGNSLAPDACISLRATTENRAYAFVKFVLSERPISARPWIEVAGEAYRRQWPC